MLEFPTGTAGVVVPLVGASVGELTDQLCGWSGLPIDLVEWRADFLPDITGQVAVDVLEQLSTTSPAPILFTLRSQAEGGHFPADDGYRQVVEHVAAHGRMRAIDVETSRPGMVDAMNLAHSRGVEVWGSHHDFDSTPALDVLVATLDSAFQAGADVAKLAVMPHDAGDVARLLSATWQASNGGNLPVVTMAMGQLGQLTRLCGHQFGSRYTFATVGTASAPGQVSLRRLQEVRNLLSQCDEERPA